MSLCLFTVQTKLTPPRTLRSVTVPPCDHGPMNIEKMLIELREERAGVEQAILTLERLASGRGKRRGRPPAWMTQVKRHGRPKGSKNTPKSDE
jgi:hypothetical protein